MLDLGTRTDLTQVQSNCFVRPNHTPDHSFWFKVVGGWGHVDKLTIRLSVDLAHCHTVTFITKKRCSVFRDGEAKLKYHIIFDQIL